MNLSICQGYKQLARFTFGQKYIGKGSIGYEQQQNHFPYFEVKAVKKFFYFGRKIFLDNFQANRELKNLSGRVKF